MSPRLSVVAEVYNFSERCNSACTLLPWCWVGELAPHTKLSVEGSAVRVKYNQLRTYTVNELDLTGTAPDPPR